MTNSIRECDAQDFIRIVTSENVFYVCKNCGEILDDAPARHFLDAQSLDELRKLVDEKLRQL